MFFVQFLQSIISNRSVTGFLAALSVLLTGSPAAVPAYLEQAQQSLASQAEAVETADGSDQYAVMIDVNHSQINVNLDSGYSDRVQTQETSAPAAWISLNPHAVPAPTAAPVVPEPTPAPIEPAATAAPTPEPTVPLPAETVPAATEAPTVASTAAPTEAPVVVDVPVVTMVPPQPQGYWDVAYAAELMYLINVYRVENGLAPLAFDYAKQLDADYAAREISVNGFNHTGRDNNIAMGYTTPSAAFYAWVNSPGHNANLLYAGAYSGAVACFIDSRGMKWWAFRI